MFRLQSSLAPKNGIRILNIYNLGQEECEPRRNQCRAFQGCSTMLVRSFPPRPPKLLVRFLLPKWKGERPAMEYKRAFIAVLSSNLSNLPECAYCILAGLAASIWWSGLTAVGHALLGTTVGICMYVWAWVRAWSVMYIARA